MSNCCPCPICFRVGSGYGPTSNKLGETKDELRERGNGQKLFFKLFQRYLGVEVENGKEQNKLISPLPPDDFTDAGLISCMECSKLMRSFCDLYNQLKTTELFLKWKARTLLSIMKQGQRVPLRVKQFREFMEKTTELSKQEGAWMTSTTTNEQIESIIKLKKSLVAKGTKCMANGFPKLSIVKWQPPQHDPGSGTPSATSKNVEVPDKIREHSETGNEVALTLTDFNQLDCPQSPTSASIDEEDLSLFPGGSRDSNKQDLLEPLESKSNVSGESTCLMGRIKAKQSTTNDSISVKDTNITRDKAIDSSDNIAKNHFNQSVVPVFKKELLDEAEEAEQDNLNEKLKPDGNLTNQNSQIRDDHSFFSIGDDETSAPMCDNENAAIDIMGDTITGESMSLSSGDDDNDDEEESSELGNNLQSISSSNPSDVTESAMPSSRLRRVHPCTVCKKTFSTAAKLDEHQRSHDTLIDPSDSEDDPGEDSSGSEYDGYGDGDDELMVNALENDDPPTEALPVQIAGIANSTSGLQNKFLSTATTEKDNKDPSQTCAVKVKPDNVLKPKRRRGRPSKDVQTKRDKMLKPKRKYTKYKTTRRRPTNEKIFPLKIWNCKVETCSEKFSLEADYKNHQQLHGTFNCSQCNTSKAFAADLAWHEIAEHSNDRTKKKVAQMSETKISRLHTTDMECPRPMCPYRTGSKAFYIRHFLADHLNLPVDSAAKLTRTCKICKFVFSSNGKHSNLCKQKRVHYQRHHNLSNILKGFRPQRCDQKDCPAYFLTERQLRHHKYTEHKIKRTYDCAACNKKYLSTGALRGHQRKYQQDKLTHPCPVDGCNVQFETKYKLKLHTRQKHTGQRKAIQCPKCEKVCDGEPAFQSHMKAHAQVKNKWICEQCGKGFPNHENLQRHYLSHAGPECWEFLCSVCSKKCISQQKLDEHMRTLTKAKPFVCEICGERYAHRHNLRNHVNSKHGQEVQDIPRRYNKANLPSRKGIKRKRASNVLDNL